MWFMLSKTTTCYGIRYFCISLIPRALQILINLLCMSNNLLLRAYARYVYGLFFMQYLACYTGGGRVGVVQGVICGLYAGAVGAMGRGYGAGFA
jgi:hypothetical protein